MPQATHSTESHCSFLLQQCLPEAGPNQHCHTSNRHPGGCLGHLPRRRSAPRRCAQAITRTPRPPSTARSSWRFLPPASPWPCLAALILTVRLWRICQISSAVSWGHRICGDTDEATSQQGGWIPNSSGYQETKPGGLGEQAGGTQQNTCYSWKAPKGTAQAGYWLDNTHLGDFPETLYLNEQMKSKGLGDQTPACTRWGPSNLAWQRISLTSTPWGTETLRAEPQAGFPQPQGHFLGHWGRACMFRLPWPFL